MTVAADLSLDYLLVEDPETVTLRVKTGEGQYTPQTVNYADRHKATRGQVDKLGKQTVTFHLWAANLAGTTPRPDYEITGAGGDNWVIDSVEVCDLGERFRCQCTKL